MILVFIYLFEFELPGHMHQLNCKYGIIMDDKPHTANMVYKYNPFITVWFISSKHREMSTIEFFSVVILLQVPE